MSMSSSIYNNNNKINVTGIRAAAFDLARASP